jgi:poly [ADP-ribose] polymerase
MANIVEHRKFICVEFGDTNNNKVWQYTVYDDGSAMTEWGRVGNKLSSKMTTKSDALSKMRQKTNENNSPDKRYTEVKAIDGNGTTSTSSTSSVKVGSSELKNIAKKQIKYNNPIVAKFIDYLTDVNAHNILNATKGSITYSVDSGQFKTPMGIIMPEMVSEARDLLFELAQMVQKKQHGVSLFSTKLNEYLRRIPHNVGMKKIDPYTILPDMNKIQEENDILDGLDASFNDVTSGKKKDDAKVIDKIDEPKIFDVQLHLVEDKKEIERIRVKYERTKKTQHQSYKYQLKDVYQVVIKNMHDAFEKNGKPIGNIMELYHGTKVSNVLSILRKGLVIPPANASYVCGRLAGDGLYFSDISSKSLNYATNYWTSGGNTSRIFMFICDIAMGKAFSPTGSYYGSYPKVGYDSTFLKAGCGSVINNEMIVYKLYQANLKYLLEFC